MTEFRAHVDAHVAALSEMTYRHWFAGRSAYLKTHTPAASDLGEQAMRADYIADKAWWYLTYEPEEYATFEAAAKAAAAELPPVSQSRRSVRPGWLDDLNIVVTSTAGTVPSRQWGTTLIPVEMARISQPRDVTPDST